MVKVGSWIFIVSRLMKLEVRQRAHQGRRDTDAREEPPRVAVALRELI